MPPITLTRQQLYDRVWTTPVETLAHTLGLSGRGLGKLCGRLRIPVPPRGYWARKAAGQRVARPPLPPFEGRLSQQLEFLIEPDAGMADPVPEVHPLIAFERDPANRIIVPDDLQLTDSRILRAGRLLAKAKLDSTKLTIPPADTLFVRAARSEHERALRIMQVLVVACEARGFAVSVTAEGPRIAVLGELVGFGIEERLDKVDHRRTYTEQSLIDRGLGYGVPQCDLIPSRRLALVITNVRGVRQRWVEDSSARLEELLNRFIIGLVRAAIGLKQQQDAAEQRERERLESERLRQEEEARAEAARLRWREEQARIERLERLATVSERHTRLRAAVDGLREALGPVAPESELARWLAWATDHVERSDPFRRVRKRKDGLLELYFYGYDGDRSSHEGFKEPASHGWENDKPKSGIKLTDRPPQESGYERAVKVSVPEDILLPYEWPQDSNWFWRVFRVPAVLLNDTLKLGASAADDET